MKSDFAQKGAPEKMEGRFCSMRGVLKSGLTTDQWLVQTRDRGEIQLKRIDALREHITPVEINDEMLNKFKSEGRS